MEVSGKIKVLGDLKTFGDNGFRKREVVITTQEQYPQHLLIEFVQDRCELLDSFNIGENVKISINLRGREWENPQGDVKYFNSIHGWRIEKEDPTGNDTIPSPDEAPGFEVKSDDDKEVEDDLPF
ncbi:MAG: DUF3127 domain-containing protein [Flavobacteriales bacterium]|nr:MAG: DUF3127 domain-containing protein [Flavobacteriales bacterium]